MLCSGQGIAQTSDVSLTCQTPSASMSHNLAAKGSRLRITSIRTLDVRFPTSREMDGSDAMNPDPDYSAAYVELITDSDAQLTGSGFVFTIGRGNEVEVAAIKAV